MKPWEKYTDATQSDPAPQAGPWAKYSASTPDSSPSGASAPASRPANADSIANKILGLGKEAAGAGEAALSAVSSIPASIIGNVYGIGKTLTSGQYGTQAGIDVGRQAAEELAGKLTYKPQTAAGRRDVAGVARALDASKLEGLPADASLVPQIPEVPRAAVRTGEQAAGIAGRAGQAVGGAADQAVQGAARRAANALPPVDPETLQLARTGHAMGFRFRPDQLYENKFARIGGQLMSDVPLSGEATSHNQQVFNRALLRMIGGEGDKLTRGNYAAAMDQAGKTIGRAFDARNVPIDNALIGRLRAMAGNQLPEVQGVINGYVRDLESLAGPVPKLAGGGRIAQPRLVPGKDLGPLLSKLKTQIRQTSNGDLRHALIGFKDEIEDSILPQLLPAEREEYAQALKRYAIGQTIQPLVAKSPGGNFSPRALMGAVTSNSFGKRMMATGRGGDLGQLADIGSLFLREPGTSNTAERGAVMAALAGGGFLGGAPAAIPPYLAANVYNRFGPRVTEQLLQRPPSQ